MRRRLTPEQITGKALFYVPAIPERYSADHVKTLAPNDPTRTILAVVASAEPIGKVVVETAAKIDGDSLLSNEGRGAAKQAAFVDLVVKGALEKNDAALRLASLRNDEHAASLEKAAIKSANVNDSRVLALQSWLRDRPADEKHRIILDAIYSNDVELLAACLNAPKVWRVLTDQQRERAREALIVAHDPKRAAEILDFKTLIQCAREGFDSLVRFSRDALKLQPPAAKPVPVRRA